MLAFAPGLVLDMRLQVPCQSLQVAYSAVELTYFASPWLLRSLVQTDRPANSVVVVDCRL